MCELKLIATISDQDYNGNLFIYYPGSYVYLKNILIYVENYFMD